MFDNCKTINKFINKFDEYGNFKKNILTEDKIYQKDYLTIVDELKYLYSNQIITENILTMPSSDEFRLLRVINTCCALEHKTDKLSKYIKVPEHEIKKNGYKYRVINTLQSQYLEKLFFDKKFQISNRNLKQEYSIDNKYHELNIIRNNNTSDPLSKYDFDGKIENSIIYIDIKGRYNNNGCFFNNLKDDNNNSLNIDSNKYLNLDVKTIYKYYCRQLHEGCKIWLAFYHNYSPCSFGINFLDFDKLLYFINITKLKGKVIPQMSDLKSNPFITYPFDISLNDNRISEVKSESYLNDIIYYQKGSFNYPSTIHFDYTKLCCSMEEFLNAISEQINL